MATQAPLDAHETYRKLVQDALRILQAQQPLGRARAIGVMACIGFDESSVVGTAVLAPGANEAVTMAMVLACIRSLANAETCKRTLAQLGRVDSAMQLAIEEKLGTAAERASLH